MAVPSRTLVTSASKCDEALQVQVFLKVGSIPPILQIKQSGLFASHENWHHFLFGTYGMEEKKFFNSIIGNIP